MGVLALARQRSLCDSNASGTVVSLADERVTVAETKAESKPVTVETPAPDSPIEYRRQKNSRPALREAAFLWRGCFQSATDGFAPECL